MNPPSVSTPRPAGKSGSRLLLLNKEHTTIILTTHYMDEAEKLCGRIAFVDRGRLIALDTLDNLRKLIPAGDLIEIGVDHMDPQAEERSGISALSTRCLLSSIR